MNEKYKEVLESASLAHEKELEFVKAITECKEYEKLVKAAVYYADKRHNDPRENRRIKKELENTLWFSNAEELIKQLSTYRESLMVIGVLAYTGELGSDSRGLMQDIANTILAEPSHLKEGSVFEKIHTLQIMVIDYAKLEEEVRLQEVAKIPKVLRKGEEDSKNLLNKVLKGIKAL